MLWRLGCWVGLIQVLLFVSLLFGVFVIFILLVYCIGV